MRTYNPRNIPLARQLRKNMTPWERKLWYEYLRTCPVRFQRQKAFGEYIADFPPKHTLSLSWTVPNITPLPSSRPMPAALTFSLPIISMFYALPIWI
mgnify:CR=1 FL=1